MCSSHRGTRMEFSKREFFFLSRFFLWYSDYKLRIVIENWFVRIWRNETTEFLNNIFKRKSMEKREGKFCGGWFDLPVKRSCSIRNCIGFFLIVTQEILFNGNLLTLLPNNFTRSFARNSPIISFGRKTIRCANQPTFPREETVLRHLCHGPLTPLSSHPHMRAYIGRIDDFFRGGGGEERLSWKLQRVHTYMDMQWCSLRWMAAVVRGLVLINEVSRIAGCAPAACSNVGIDCRFCCND